MNFTVTLQSSAVAAGDWVSATLNFEKDSDEDVVLEFANSCLVGYKVYSGNAVVMEYPTTCDGDPKTWNMTRTGFYSTSVDVPTLEYDMDNVVKNGVWNLEAPRLPAGQYRLRVGVIGYEATIPWVDLNFEVTPSN